MKAKWTIQAIDMRMRHPHPPMTLRCHVSPSRRWAIEGSSSSGYSVTHLPSHLRVGGVDCRLRDLREWCDLADERLGPIATVQDKIDDADLVRQRGDELRAIVTSAGRLW